MPCFKPIKACQSTFTKDNGRSVISFDISKAVSHPERYTLIEVPCGQCIGCRIDRSKQWAVRCVHEASLYMHNCFITLTYSDDNLDRFDEKKCSNCSVFLRNQVHCGLGSLCKKDFQLFMKRLRKEFKGYDAVNSETNKITYPIRYFHCGEYGDLYCRPHHHACLFNFDFPDKKLQAIRKGVRHYSSLALERLWPFGISSVGAVTFQSAAYVARYITKKINGPEGAEYYARVDDDTGEFYYLEPEYISMSRRPGIGKGWYDKYKEGVYSRDFITMEGRKFQVPGYYDRLYDIEAPEKLFGIKEKRLLDMLQHVDNNTPKRLAVREQVLLSNVKRLKRGFEK